VPRIRRPVHGALTAAALLGLAACSGSTESSGAAVAEGDAATCPADVVDVVVSVGQWGELVRALGGDCATVTTIVSSGSVDPHDFEPGTADLAAFQDADLVVVNGAHYDEWAEDAAGTLDPVPPTVSAAEVAGAVADDVDPHLWVDPAVVSDMATAITDALIDVSGDGAAYFEEQQGTWRSDAQEYFDAVAHLQSVAAGHTYAATEGVFDRLAHSVGLTDVTPAGYLRAASNDSEPAPGDLVAFETALTDGSVDVLIYNAQTSGSLPEQLRETAEQADVPVVEVTESPVDPAGSFVSWQLAEVQQLTDALSRTP
jgi:zinc/manganese transport system substrate-binding protein